MSSTTPSGDTSATSASMATDPDRILLEQFEQGRSGLGEGFEDPAISGGRKIERLAIPEQDPIGSATFVIRNEDHTLGNLLRWMIMQNPAVEYCGYSIPHPSEAKIHLRIQAKNIPAIDVLNKALDQIIDLSYETISQYQKQLEDYEKNSKA